MLIKSENHLYRVFTEAVKKFENSMSFCPEIKSWTNGKLEFSEKMLHGRQLYLLGEEHQSRKPVDYIHQNLVQRIRSNTRTWLVLREDADTVLDGPSTAPAWFYIRELAKLFKLPYENAIPDLFAPDTLKYINMKTGACRDDINGFFLSELSEFLKRSRDESLDLEKIAPDFLHIPLEEVHRLQAAGIKTNFDFDELVGKPWNEYSKGRFHKLLAQYPDKTHILVSVGYKHLPIFE